MARVQTGRKKRQPWSVTISNFTKGRGERLTLRYSTTVAVLAANRIDRKNEIDAVPAISPHTRFGVQLSRTC